MFIIACERKYVQNFPCFSVSRFSKPILFTKYEKVSYTRFVEN